MTEARFTYIVMCHTDPQGALRLVRRIREWSPQASVLVRHDVPGLFAPGEVEAAGGVRLHSPVQVTWGDWSQVRMQLEALGHATRHVPGSHYVLISGQDYPIRDLAEWERELVAAGADAYLQPLTIQPDDRRLSWRVLPEPRVVPAPLRRLARGVVGRLAARTAHPRVYPVGRGSGPVRWWVGTPRRRPLPVAPAKASTWCVLTDQATRAVLHLDATRPELSAAFRTVRTPDEYYLPTLVHTLGLSTVARPTAHTWFPPGGASPRWVDADLMNTLEPGQAAFVRKIPADVDPRVLAVADALAGAGRTPAPGSDFGH